MSELATTEKERNIALAYSNRPGTPGNEEVLGGDLVVPRVRLLQSQSEAVNDGKAKTGDIVVVPGLRKLGDLSTYVELIPLTYQNWWVVNRFPGGNKEFVGLQPRTHANQNLPWEYNVEGVAHERSKLMRFFALLSTDVLAKEKAINGEAGLDLHPVVPVTVDFQVMSFPAGSAVINQFASVQEDRQVWKRESWVYDNVILLSARATKNDKGHFNVYTAHAGRKTSAFERNTATRWLNRLAEQAVKVYDDSKDSTE